MTEKLYVAPWPLVCDDCTKALAMRVYDRRDLSAITLYCRHNGTLVMARNGEHEGQPAVLRWDVTGPLSEAEAVEMIGSLGGVASLENLDSARVH